MASGMRLARANADDVEREGDHEHHHQDAGGEQELAGQQEAADEPLRRHGHQRLVGDGEVGEQAGPVRCCPRRSGPGRRGRG